MEKSTSDILHLTSAIYLCYFINATTFLLYTMLSPNKGKKLAIETKKGVFERYPVRTHLITNQDNIINVVKKYVTPYLKSGDLITIAESAVAISQGRAFKINEIKVGRLAKFLVKFVHKPSYGIGLGCPETMQLALNEIGTLRILFAAFLSAITKPFGIRGVFYRIAGRKAALIDGPVDYAIPPYNKYATLGPKNPDKVVKEISEAIGYPVVIIDANDIGVAIIAVSDNTNPKLIEEMFKDNPLGQTDEQTPIAIVRKQ